MTKTISLTTDYLIIGAGAMGMGFLDELINNENIVSFFESFFDGFSVSTDQSWQDVYLR